MFGKFRLGTNRRKEEKVLANRSETFISLRHLAKGILAEMTVAATVEHVWRILTSFEEMPAHLSNLKNCKVLKREGSYRLVEQAARVGTPLLPFPFRVVMDVVEERPFLYFNQRHGSFTSFSGHWRVEPDAAGSGSRVRYYLEASFGQGWSGRALRRQFRRLIRQNLQELAAWMDNGGI